MAQGTNKPQNNGSYAENSPLVRLLGRKGRVKILDVFLRKHYTDLTASEVADLAGVSRSTFHRNIDELKAVGIIKEDKRVAGPSVFHLNKESEIARILAEAQEKLWEHSELVVSETDPQIRLSIERLVADEIEQSKNAKPPQDETNETEEMTDEVSKQLATS